MIYSCIVQYVEMMPSLPFYLHSLHWTVITHPYIYFIFRKYFYLHVHNEYIIKQYRKVIVMCIHTYSLNRWNAIGYHRNINIIDKREKNNDWQSIHNLTIHNTNVCFTFTSWNVEDIIGYHHNMILVDKREKKIIIN